jgi:16S rRNA (adenine1518-N6/adenine1519-N6)-dimethyltransferase
LPIDLGSIPPLDAASLLKRYGLRADKRLGQNFLQDPSALEKIVRVAEIQPADTALEIGPGLGNLTRYLAVCARKVVAVELDRDLFPPLQAVLAPYDNVRIIHGDILKLAPAELIDQDGYIVVANIPYYITSAIIRHLLDVSPKGEPSVRPRRVVLTVQKEVAERICAAPGHLSLLALSVQVYGQPRPAGRIPAGAFHPAPNIDSTILIIDVYPEPLMPSHLRDEFFQLIKAGFSQKRKTLRNSLSGGLRISPTDAEELLKLAEIDVRRRAETLHIDEWKRLAMGRAGQINRPARSIY